MAKFRKKSKIRHSSINTHNPSQLLEPTDKVFVILYPNFVEVSSDKEGTALFSPELGLNQNSDQ